jgi:hypothetical protein
MPSTWLLLDIRYASIGCCVLRCSGVAILPIVGVCMPGRSHIMLYLGMQRGN